MTQFIGVSSKTLFTRYTWRSGAFCRERGAAVRCLLPCVLCPHCGITCYLEPEGRSQRLRLVDPDGGLHSWTCGVVKAS